MTKGQRVTIRPISYPLQVWDGVILRKTPSGYSVQYEAWGMRWKTVFSPKELEAA